MRKVLVQGVSLVGFFLAFWLMMRQVDWVALLRIERVSSETEERLGELLWDLFKKSDEEITEEWMVQTVDSIVTRLCEANDLDRGLFQVHLLQKAEVNAFALPAGHLVIQTGLIRECQSAEELAGVVGHEMAHIVQRHVMQKLIREIGLSVLISVSTGSGGGEILKEAAKVLSSTAFDRSLEKEADLHAVKYLQEASMNPQGFADFLLRLSTEEPEMLRYFSWLSTHPDTRERAEYIEERLQNKKMDYTPVLAASTWEQLKAQAAE